MLQLRSGSWHQGAFRRFVRAARDYLEHRPPQNPIPRWITEGFWELDVMAWEWLRADLADGSTHEAYRARVETVHLLASWLFTGSNPQYFPWEAG